jgi:hypothetical protein
MMRFLTGERYAIQIADEHGGLHWRYYRFKFLASLRVRWANRTNGKEAGMMLGWTL